MTTWRLWRYLRHPLRQTQIYRWVWQSLQKKPEPSTESKKLVLREILMFVGLCLAFALLPLTLFIVVILFISVVAFCLAFNGTLLGCGWIYIISGQLAYHRHAGRSHVLASTSEGLIGNTWIIATVCIHHHNILHDVNRILRWIVRVVFVFLTVLLGIILLTLQQSNPTLQDGQLNLLLDVIDLMTLSIAFWIDHVQSIVIALLIAVTAPTYTTEQPTLRVVTLSAFLTLQIGFYVVMGLVFTAIQSSTSVFITEPITQRLVVTIGLLIIFYATREMLITALYRHLLNRYETTESEFQSIVT